MSFLTAVIMKQAVNLFQTEFVKHEPEIQGELLKEAAVAAQRFMDYIQSKSQELQVQMQEPPQG